MGCVSARTYFQTIFNDRLGKAGTLTYNKVNKHLLTDVNNKYQHLTNDSSTPYVNKTGK